MNPNLSNLDHNMLYIIGNGFDLAHNIKSKYSNFASWLYLNDHEPFVENMEKMFPMSDYGHPLIWSDFEGVLGRYNPAYIQSYMNVNPADIYNKNDVNESMATVKKIVRCIRPLMKEWAKNIDISTVEPRFTLNKEAKYLTFNYTKTLENVYYIPQKNICHIHGCVDSNEGLIVGHVQPRDTIIYTGKDEEEIPQSEIITTMNKLDKCVKKQLDKHSIFFDSLGNIDSVVVIGHSLTMIDEQYFHEVKRKINSDAYWCFTFYNQQDKSNIDSFVKRINLSSDKYDTCNINNNDYEIKKSTLC